MMLDIAKAALPVGLAYQQWGWDGWPMFLVAMAAPLGHAFSPFLRFRGGKALATMFGVWIGLSTSTYSIPVLLMLIVWIWYWTTMAGRPFWLSRACRHPDLAARIAAILYWLRLGRSV